MSKRRFETAEEAFAAATEDAWCEWVLYGPAENDPDTTVFLDCEAVRVYTLPTVRAEELSEPESPALAELMWERDADKPVS